MTVPTAPTAGRSTGGKPINLSQLQQEIIAAGVSVTGLSLVVDTVSTYDANGALSDFAVADQPVVDQVIADHVALRDKTPEEYSEEFQNPSTPPQRKQELRDITAGLLPAEQVPMTREQVPM